MNKKDKEHSNVSNNLNQFDINLIQDEDCNKNIENMIDYSENINDLNKITI